MYSLIVTLLKSVRMEIKVVKESGHEFRSGIRNKNFAFESGDWRGEEAERSML